MFNKPLLYNGFERSYKKENLSHHIRNGKKNKTERKYV